MVSKKDLEDSIAKLSDDLTDSFKKMLDDSIVSVKDTIITNLKHSNENLQQRLSELENDIILLKNANIDLTSRCESAFQHERLNQIIISGIPSSVTDENLEGTAVRILNQVKDYKVNERSLLVIVWEIEMTLSYALSIEKTPKAVYSIEIN